MQNDYDFLVIGSGPAGHSAAITAAENGLRTAIIEMDPLKIGGTCLNEGCIPAKSLYNSARILNEISLNSSSLGITSPDPAVSISSFVEKSDSAVTGLKKGLNFILKKNDITVIEGRAVLKDKESVDVLLRNGDSATVTFKDLLIAAGSKPKALPEIPFDGEKVISSSDAIVLRDIPAKILIVGAGAIGTEFASYFNIMGSDVTIVEAEPRLLPNEDRDISNTLKSSFRKRNITAKLSTTIKGVDFSPGGIVAFFSDGDTIEYDKILVSIGREPLTSKLSLEKAGIDTDSKGFIPVNNKMRTSAENIYAAGDVIRTPMLAHTASAEGKIAAFSAAGDNPAAIDYDSVPNVVYTLIETASVGITEERAEELSMDFTVNKCFFKANGRAVAYSETDGFIKVITDNRTNKILGAHIIGHYASELIHEFVLAKNNGLTISDISNTVHAHPTFSEMAGELWKS